ncbi:uncharacterized protein LOC114278075 [Camellia sinensis]|uniref:uncharacterized protein LOC114278075 n=1 Tax=Camellia sinensis TaxID=4442 RepID=UPI001036E441|nr:uncharacterized protein LOC114278075 [Camellia sinensis]
MARKYNLRSTESNGIGKGTAANAAATATATAAVATTATEATNTVPVNVGEMMAQLLQLTEVQKLELATHQLEGAALFWWNSWKEGLDLTTLTWADFKIRFDWKFVPTAIRSQLSDEFSKLTQEGRTVIEYVTKFNELSRYAPYLIDTQEKKNEKFIKGLNHYLSKSLIPFDAELFDRVFDLALKYEEKKKQFKEGNAKAGETSRGSHFQQRDGNRYRPYDQRHRG